MHKLPSTAASSICHNILERKLQSRRTFRWKVRVEECSWHHEGSSTVYSQTFSKPPYHIPAYATSAISSQNRKHEPYTTIQQDWEVDDRCVSWESHLSLPSSKTYTASTSSQNIQTRPSLGFPAFRVYKGLPEDFGTWVIDEAVTCGYKILVHSACYRLFRRPCVNVAQEDQREWTEYRKRETGGGFNTNKDGKMTIADLDDVPEQKENEADKGDSSGGATNYPEAEIVKERHYDSRQISIDVETWAGTLKLVARLWRWIAESQTITRRISVGCLIEMILTVIKSFWKAVSYRLSVSFFILPYSISLRAFSCPFSWSTDLKWWFSPIETWSIVFKAQPLLCSVLRATRKKTVHSCSTPARFVPPHAMVELEDTEIEDNDIQIVNSADRQPKSCENLMKVRPEIVISCQFVRISTDGLPCI